MIRMAMTGLAMGWAACGTALANPLDVWGTFATEDGRSHIEIADCGDGTPCGSVVWIDADLLEEGDTVESLVDANGDRVLGLTLLQGFEPRRSSWKGGRIYDPEAGKTYASRLKRLPGGALQVKGCIGPICQTQRWKEVRAQSQDDAARLAATG